nr:ABC transporter ATP-binding protein/permease [Methylocapsa aurea]
MEQTKTISADALGAMESNNGLAPQIASMARAFIASPGRYKMISLGVAICAVVGATAYGQIRLNAWNQPFYDALARKDVVEFAHQLAIFAGIAVILLILNVTQVWLNQMTKMKLREQLTRDLFDQWLEPMRAFRLAGSGQIGINPDQRIHEDARHLTELSTDLGIGLLQATLLLASFVGVLWILSDHVAFTIHGSTFVIPGYMVWCALLYAGTASWLSWRVGHPLIDLNAERYAREADLRFALVKVNERANALAVGCGERNEKDRLNRELDQVLVIMRSLVTGVTRLTWITAGYGWFAIVAPIVVAAPGFFSGDLSLGGLMVVVGAFNQVQQALRWFVDNFSTIADWRATLVRVASFRLALVQMDKLGHKTNRIERVPATDDKLTFDNLGIASPSGCTKLSEPHVAIAPAEHVLIRGAPGIGKTNLFCAIAGLWPWGSGRILLPSLNSMQFLPQRPYIPAGLLRDALAYPSRADNFNDPEFVAALDRMGLSRLAPGLDRSARWDKELSDAEQRDLAFARLLLHKPRWILIDGAIDALDSRGRARVLDLLQRELPQTAVINIGRQEPEEAFFTRVLSLTKDPEGLRLVPTIFPKAPARAMEQTASAP